MVHNHILILCNRHLQYSSIQSLDFMVWIDRKLEGKNLVQWLGLEGNG